MVFPTTAICALFDNTLASCAATNNRFIKMMTLPPSTAALFGVTPHSEIRNNIAESAMPFTIIVIKDKRVSVHVSAMLLSDLAVSATEKKIRAITPINSALNVIRNSLSLYGSLPE